ncbi:TPA: hypothetical protein RXN19_001757 [Campylobacter jejuni]|nr:hypothetical protein [Campylobacter jejuni]
MGITVNIWKEIPELKNLKKYLSEKEILGLDSYEKCAFGSQEYVDRLVRDEKIYYLNTNLENRNFILKQALKLEKNEIKTFLHSDNFITFAKDMILFISKNENFSRNNKLPTESIQKLKKELLEYIKANNLTIK